MAKNSLPRIAFAVALLAGTATAQAATSAQPDEQLAAQAQAPLEQKVERPLPLLGLMLGAGVPDGASASAVVRPFSWVRGEAGLSYNMISKGVRAGVSLLPFGSGPSATL